MVDSTRSLLRATSYTALAVAVFALGHAVEGVPAMVLGVAALVLAAISGFHYCATGYAKIYEEEAEQKLRRARLL